MGKLAHFLCGVSLNSALHFPPKSVMGLRAPQPCTSYGEHCLARNILLALTVSVGRTHRSTFLILSRTPLSTQPHLQYPKMHVKIA